MNPREPVGKWGEAIAVAWLIERGYEVFIGFGNTSCDLIALRDGIPFRVEVKAQRTPGKPYVCIRENRFEKFDMLLVVDSEGRVYQDPVPCAVGGAPTLAEMARAGAVPAAG